jgi:hypothetical protein
VAALADEREAGSIRGGLVAVAGLLSYDPRSARCSDPGLAVVFCNRTAVLEPAPGEATGSPGAGSLRVRVPAGIPMPSMFAADPPPDAPGQALLSVLVGRFVHPRPPACQPGACQDDFALERLAWAAGTWIDRILVRDPLVPESTFPATGRRAQAIAIREADRMEQILSLAILGPGWLETLVGPIGQVAAQGAAEAGIRAGPFWYLRSVGRRSATEVRSLTWAVIDHQSGFVLASGAIDPG